LDDTYMTVIHLDDTNIFEKTTSTSTTETSGDPKPRFKYHCPSILRLSKTYRWTTGYSFQHETPHPSLYRPSSIYTMNINSSSINSNDKESHSSTESSYSFPVPEYVFVNVTE
jgi:hypothetical protein